MRVELLARNGRRVFAGYQPDIGLFFRVFPNYEEKVQFAKFLGAKDKEELKEVIWGLEHDGWDIRFAAERPPNITGKEEKLSEPLFLEWTRFYCLDCLENLEKVQRILGV